MYFTLIVVAAAVVGAGIAVQSPGVQTRIAEMVLRSASNRIDGDIVVGKVHIDPFKALVIKDVAIIDKHPYISPDGTAPADTIFKAGYVTARFGIKSLLGKGGIRITSAKVSDGFFFLTIEPAQVVGQEDSIVSGNTVNLKRIFRLGRDTAGRRKSGGEIFYIGDLRLERMAFMMKNFTKDRNRYGQESINWHDLEVRDISMEGRQLKMKGGVMSGICNKLSFREKSGYVCHSLSGRAEVGNGKTAVEEFHLADSWSDIGIQSLALTYSDTRAWSSFITDVRMQADIGQSFVSMNTLGYFAPALKRFNMTAKVQGHADGYVSSLKLSGLQFATSDCMGLSDWHPGRGISGEIGGTVTGLPDTGGMTVEADVRDVRFTTSGLEHFIRGWSPSANIRLGRFCVADTLSFGGRLSGPLDRLKVNGTVHAGSGLVQADIDLKNLTDRAEPIIIGGTVETDDLDISRIAGENLPVKECGMTAVLTATLAKGRLEVDIDTIGIRRLNVLGYDYTGIEAAGTYSRNAFDGRIECHDPNLNLMFRGIFTIAPKAGNAIYRFSADLAHADLHALNMDKREISTISFRSTADLAGTGGEDIVGDIDLQDIMLTDKYGTHNVEHVGIVSLAGNGENRIRLTSEFAEGTYEGSRFLNSFMRDLQTVTTRRELPSLYAEDAPEWSGNHYSLSLKFHVTKEILSFFAPGAYIENNTSVTMDISRDGDMKAQLKSGRIALKDKYMKNVSLIAGNAGGSLAGILAAEEISVSPVLIRNSRLKLTAKNDSLEAGFMYDNDTEKENSGDMRLVGRLFRGSDGKPGIRASFLPSSFSLNSTKWDIASSEITVSGGRTNIGDLFLTSEGQSIRLDGGFSPAQADTLRLNLDKVDLDMANAFIAQDFGIGGQLSGEAMLSSPLDGHAGIIMNLTCDSAEFGGQRVGTVHASSEWNEKDGVFDYLCRNNMDQAMTFSVKGHLRPDTKQIDGKVALRGFNVGYASPFLSSIFGDMEGSISGDIAYIGPVSEIGVASRDLRIDRAVLKVGYTNVAYTVSGPVSLDSKGVRFDNLTISDRFNAGGTVSGSIWWNHFKDIAFDTSIKFHGMEVLNTAETDNPSFYGKAFASGKLAITGPLEAIRLSADASTEKTGDIHIPLNSMSSAGVSNLLTFKEPQREIVIDPYEEMLKNLKTKDKRKNDLGIKLRINASRDVQAVIEIDRAAGNVLTGRGSGLIELDIRPGNGVFNINGNYNILEGNYHLVALGIAQRDFVIRDGSTVKFNGDVMDSDLDINAVYSTRAAVGTLISDTTSTTSRRIVECGIAITGKIRNPQLDFSINIPDLDPTTQTRVESALNTQDKVQRQLLALLITGSFLPDEQSGITNTSSSMLFSNVSEIMAGQLNNILQKLNIPVDFGLDYQQSSSGTDIFDVALSTALFNNRVTVNGTIGNRQYGTGSSGSEVVGDLDIDVKLDKPGVIRLNLFSHSADQYTNYLDNSQRNGVGITCQKEYDTIGEFLRNLFSSKKKRQEREAGRLQDMMNMDKVKIEIGDVDTASGTVKKARRNGQRK